MELSEIRTGHFCHMGYGSMPNHSVIVDEFGNAYHTGPENISLQTLIARICFYTQGAE